MNDDQRMARIMDWLEDRLSPDEALAFLEEKIGNAGLAEECALMENLLASLQNLDNETAPTPDFHQNLMARLVLTPQMSPAQSGLEQFGQGSGLAAGTARGADRMPTQGDDEMGKARAAENTGRNTRQAGWQAGLWQRLIRLFRRRPYVPAAVTVCCLALLYFTLGGNGYGGYRNYAADNYSSSSRSTGGAGMGSVTMSAPQAAPMPIIEEKASMNIQAGEMDFGFDDVAADGETASLMRGVPVAGSGQDADVATSAVGQKIIRTGNLSLEVTSYDLTIAAIKSSVTSSGGYVTNESVYLIDARERKAGGVEIKVPYDQYDQILAQVAALGKVTDQHVNAQDVTEEFVDVTARIEVYETKRDRLYDLLAQSGKLSDVLAVENELADTNAVLESLQGRLRYLTSRTDYSTLYVNLTEKAKEAVEIKTTGLDGFFQQVREAFFLGINGFLGAIGSLLIWLVGHFIQGLLLVAALVFCWLRWLRPRRRKKSEEIKDREVE